MTISRVTFEDGTVGVKYELDPPNNGSSAVNALIGNEHPAHGTQSLAIDTANSYQYDQVNFDDTPLTYLAEAAAFYTDTTPPSTTGIDVLRLFNGITGAATTDRVKVEWIASGGSGKFRLTDAAGVAATTAGLYASNAQHRFAIKARCAAAGTPLLQLTLYTGADSTTPVETITVASPTLPPQFTSRRLGKQVSSALTMGKIWLDDWTWSDAPAVDWPLPPGTSSPLPVANAGADRYDVEPGALVTLDSSATTGATSRVWSLAAHGTAAPDPSDPTAVSPTFAAPPEFHTGVTLDWLLTATNSAGTAADHVLIQVQPATVGLCTSTGIAGAVLSLA